MVKVFDLRLPGGKVYHAADLDPCNSSKSAAISSIASSEATSPFCCQYHRDARWNRHDYSLFLSVSKGAWPGQKPRVIRRRGNTPVYSLSSPSPCSPTLFAGIENDVLQIDVVSVMDRDPDPIYQTTGKWTRNESNMKKRWLSRPDEIQMALYEHRQDKITLIVQREIDYAIRSTNGWDELWSNSKLSEYDQT